MAEDRNPIRLAADIGGAVGFVGLLVTAIMWFLSLPQLAVVMVGSLSFGALVVGVLIHVFFSNSVSFQTIGEWRQGYVVSASKQRIERSLPAAQKADSSFSLEEIERHYELKKLEPNFVDN